MSSVIKVNACVYSRIGFGREKNTCSFYMNGKFTSEHHIENVQASMENRGADYLFALADNMECENPDQNLNISILKEISRFHEKISVNGEELNSHVKELESRVNDTERLISSFLEMNNVPITDTRWNLGFSGLLFSDGEFVALTGGNGHVFMIRDGMFKPLAHEADKARKALDSSFEDDKLELISDEPKGSVIVSDIYDLCEGDTFALLSDGVVEALGEEKIEDLLASRSDSTYIAHRIVDEAMKRKSNGDLAVMVVQVEKIYEGHQPIARPSRQPETKSVKNRVEKLNKVPPVTYKYNKSKRRSGRFQNAIFVSLVVLTVVVLFAILYLIIASIQDAAKDSLTTPSPSPTVTATATPTPPPEKTEEPTEPVDNPEPVDSTPEPQIIEHVVKSGESISSITRKYYGDTSLVNALCDYNNISNPNSIKIDQVIKIPPKEVLQGN